MHTVRSVLHRQLGTDHSFDCASNLLDISDCLSLISQRYRASLVRMLKQKLVTVCS